MIDGQPPGLWFVPIALVSYSLLKPDLDLPVPAIANLNFLAGNCIGNACADNGFLGNVGSPLGLDHLGHEPWAS